ncbi:MAG: methionine--tRNA ligase [Patescibacteria group bacterium]
MKKTQGDADAKKFYITTAIAYVNAAPHIGHALEFIQADALARFHRLNGDETWFVTGTDEHGTKIYEAAQKQGLGTQDFVDGNAKKFMDLKDILDLSYDDFIRTSSDRHKEGAQKIWTKMFDAGDIYKGSYKGLYCVGCEAFIPEKDLDTEGNCPIHKKKPQVLEEENYFFKLSKYSDKIKSLIASGELVVFPESRKNEMLNIIGEEGLRDVSFSRPKAVLPWGVDVPGDPEQVMYVWCDALSNYANAVDYAHEGELFKKFWPCDVHLIGKDILRFHAGIWIGMLMSADVEIPKAVYVHGFVTSEGQKMSKSIGNVVDPYEYLEKYGVDALRYYLLREIPTADDGDFSHSRFMDVYNSELANSLGNLVNRVTMMVERYLEGKVPEKTDGSEVKDVVAKVFAKYQKSFDSFDIKSAAEAVVELTNFANKYIDETKPWALAKVDMKRLAEVLYNLLEVLRYIAVLLLPILPKTAGIMAGQLGLAVADLRFSTDFGVLETGSKITVEGVLFPRIEA